VDRVILQFSTYTSYRRWDYGRFASSMIRKMAHSPFSHVDLVVGDGLLGASNSPGAPVVRGNPAGVAVRPFDYQDFGIRRRAIIMTPVAEAIIMIAESQLGKPFDSSAVSFKTFFNDEPFDRNWRDTGKWFCSELMAWAFEQADHWGRPLIWPKNRITPTDFLLLFIMSPNFIDWEKFWEPLEGVTLGQRERFADL